MGHMNWKTPTLDILGLETKEKDILNLLRDPVSVQELASKSPLPRTSLAYTLNKLVERGFVEKIMLGKRYKYYSISNEQLKLRFEEALFMTNSGTAGKKVSYHHGLKNIIRLQAEFLSSYKNERVYAIQPNKSWLSLHSKVDEERVIHVNEIIRNNNLIIDAVIEHDAYEHFKKANQNNKKFIKLAKSFGGRMADYKYAPEGFMTDQVEMWIIKNTIFFVDWREEVAIKIVDMHIAHFIKDMFLLVKKSGKKVDHNLAIRELLK